MGTEMTDPKQIPASCPRCYGTGLIPKGTDEIACPDCMGTGEIPAKAMLRCEYCQQEFEHGFLCKCNKEWELRKREVFALENIAMHLDNMYSILSRWVTR